MSGWTIRGSLSVRWAWMCVATWLVRDAGDVRVRAISDTMPLTADRRVETSGRGQRQHGVIMAAASTTVGARR
jgi:hypothetical protein